METAAKVFRNYKKSFSGVRQSIAFAIVLSSLSIYSTYAEEQAERRYEIGAVSIVRQRPLSDLGLTRTVLDSIQLGESSGGSLSELLSKHSSIFVKSYGLGSSAVVSFRGTSASHTRVEWNGMTVNNPMLGDFDFSQIPVWFSDRVELYHGASSMQTGGGALGGTVSISTKPIWDRKLYADLVQGVGSYGLYQGFISVGGGSKRVQSRVRYMYTRADNNFSYKNINVIGHPRMRQKRADYDKHIATADLFWNIGSGDVISLTTWLNLSDRSQPPIMSESVKDNRVEVIKNDDFRVSANWNRVRGRWSSRLVSGYQYMNVDYRDDNIAYGVLIASTRSSVQSLLNNYNLEYNITSNTVLKLRANVDYHKGEIVDRKFKSENTPERFEAGLGLSVHHQFNSYFAGFALLRGELTDRGVEPLMPSLGVEYRPLQTDDFIVKLNGARNYHRPTLNDLYWKPGGNRDLKPEQGYTTDLSLSYHKTVEHMNYDATVAGYLSWIDDWIVWEPASSSSYWTPRNSKRVFSRGVELYGRIGYEQDRIKVGLSANYGYTRSTNERVYNEKDKSKGKQLIFIPLHKANVMLEGGYGDWYLWWVWSFVSERFMTSSNERVLEDLPAYDLHDLTIGRRIPCSKVRFDAQFKVNNLFGRIYRALPSRPMPRQHFSFILRISF